ncbi:WW domain-containing protein [Coniochaeta sp. 2T2.1]|nr:WW domain-containing protein [Coniochaeta sp. 2T2.1]
MLKSTYEPSAALTAPLPAGWTEHKAPTGHTYYYNASTGVSTYTRPVAVPLDPAASYLQHQAVPTINLSDPNVANAFMAQYNAPAQIPQQRKQEDGNRRPPPQPKDRPTSKVPIPGHEPWVLVYTKYGRRFAYNPEKDRSYWRIPEKLMPGILELDRMRIREKAGLPATPDRVEKKTEEKEEGPAPTAQARPDAPPRPRSESAAPAAEAQEEKDYDSDEYEEVEVTDSEGEGEGEDGAEPGRASKRQRTEEPAEDQPLEFTEEDIAAQLAAMQEMEASAGEDWEEGDEGLPLSEADARALFKDLLDDHGINPYSSWEKLMEEGKIFDDARYTVLGSTRERKEVWEEWSRDKIRVLKELRAKEEKKDPRIPYIQFLQEKATPKLYWPEFRRKYKKEGPMKDVGLGDKDREKWYREHINRLRLPQATLKADLRKLLESVPLRELNNRTNPGAMPGKVVTDLRWISLDPKIRDPIVEAYVQALPGPPEEGEMGEGEESEEKRKEREERERRERAMKERERKVEEEKRRVQKRLEYERANMRDGERELEAAMRVGKRGLQSQLGGS